MAELTKTVMQIIKNPKVQVDVDENSLKKVYQKISNMLDSLSGRR